MRRVLTAGLVALGLMVAACVPAPTLTATPSTKAPGCKAVTTVTGKVAPKDALIEVTLETYRSDGKWVAWSWFTDAADGKGIIQTRIDSKGGYKLTYLAPNVSSPSSVKLRVHGKNVAKKVDVASAAWTVTRPTC